jgi:tetratricopeptide (TPR) repeat protein
VFVAEGVLALEDKKYDEALAHFRRALAREPDHVEALYYSGVAHLARGRPGEALPLLERARAQSPGEVSIAFQLGLAHFALSQHERAQPLLEEVFAREPSLDGLGYYVGYLRHRKRDYQGALAAFRAGRTTDPTIAQLTRLYTGLALAALGLPEQAAAEVEQALRLLPASPLTGPVERLRRSFQTAAPRDRRFRADVRVGVHYDDNVTVRPEGEPGSPSVHDLRRPRHDSPGELFSLSLEYDWLRRGPWEATVGYSFFTTYNNDLPSFNLMDHLATVGLGHKGTLGQLPLLSSVQYTYDFLALDDEEFVQRHSVTLATTLVENAANLSNLRARVEVKEFSEERPISSAEFQDGVNWALGLLHVFRFREDRHFIRIGYQVDLDDTRGENLDYLGHRFSAGAQYTLPWRDIRLSYDFAVHMRDYRHRHTSQPDTAPRSIERRDDEFVHQVRVEIPLPAGFSLAGDYQGTVNDSNIPAFNYRRNVYTLSVGWRY